MQPQRLHAPYDHYTVTFEEVGVPFLSEVEWQVVLGRHRFHDHREWQLLWILEGAMGLVIGEDRYDSPAGTVYLLRAGVVHRVFQRPAAPYVLFLDMRVSPTLGSGMIRFLERLAGQVVFRAGIEKLRANAAELRGALTLPEPRRTARVQALLWDMLEEMTARSTLAETENEPGVAGDLRLRIAERVMRDGLAEPLDVDRLAAAAGLSRSQLTRLYQAHYRQGPAQRLRTLRIEKARELLRATTLSIKEVADVCGFVCPNHFCRVFLQIVRSTPSAYRVSREPGTGRQRRRLGTTRG